MNGEREDYEEVKDEATEIIRNALMEQGFIEPERYRSDENYRNNINSKITKFIEIVGEE